MEKKLLDAARALYAARKGYLNPQAPMDLWAALGEALGEDTSWSAPHEAHADEEWRPLPGFPAYQVSENGRVRRVAAGRYRRGAYGPGRVLRGGIGTHGYPVVNIRVAGKQHVILVHRAVCEAFHGPAPEGKPWVAHADDNKMNPTRGNLSWSSPSENCIDAINKGLNWRWCKLTRKLADEIRAVFAGGGVAKAEIARRYGVSKQMIGLIIAGKAWNENRGPQPMRRLSVVSSGEGPQPF